MSLSIFRKMGEMPKAGFSKVPKICSGGGKQAKIAENCAETKEFQKIAKTARKRKNFGHLVFFGFWVYLKLYISVMVSLSVRSRQFDGSFPHFQ